jgi:hypothetical protein
VQKDMWALMLIVGLFIFFVVAIVISPPPIECEMSTEPLERGLCADRPS